MTGGDFGDRRIRIRIASDDAPLGAQGSYATPRNLRYGSVPNSVPWKPYWVADGIDTLEDDMIQLLGDI